MSENSYYEVYEDEVGEWRWRLKAGNNEIVANSEGYTSKQGAQEGAKADQHAAEGAEIRVL